MREGGGQNFFHEAKGGDQKFFPSAKGGTKNFFSYAKGGPEKIGDQPSQPDGPPPPGKKKDSSLIQAEMIFVGFCHPDI